jgi:long-chain fatty acid transport protein
VLLLLAQLAHGGGYYFTESGIVAAGRAGAWVAGADTQFAQYHNPAGLVRVEAPTISLGLSGVQQEVTFTRLDGAGAPLPPAENQDPAFSIPQLGFATPLGKDWALAVGFTSPFAPSYGYDPDGAQRYSVIDTTIWQFAVGPSVAWRPVPWLAVGAGVGVQALRVDYDVTVTTSGQDDEGRDNPAGDVRAVARTWDTAEPWWNVGVLVEPHERVSIGLALTPPVGFLARGDGALDFTGHVLEPNLDQTVWPDDDIALAVDLPVLARLGVAVRPHPTVEVELTGVYEAWSTLSDLQISEIDVTVTSERFGLAEDVPPTLDIPSDFRDVWGLRLGGEWRVHPQLEVRGGVLYDSGALSPAELSVSLVDPWKVQGAVGASVWLLDERLRIDGMATYVHLPTLDITDSTVSQIGVPVVGNEVPVGIVGNGTVQSHGWTAGLRLAWAFTSARREGRTLWPRPPARVTPADPSPEGPSTAPDPEADPPGATR